MKPTKAHAVKVLELVNAGLVAGMGEPTPGKMCVEAAVCFALGEPHGDRPTCVGEAVRRFKINLNDVGWSSNQARTDGMREIAIAQLGSDTIDQKEFSNRIALRTIQTFIPIALRIIVKFSPQHADALELSAKACEMAVDMLAAKVAANKAKVLTQTVHDAYADTAANDAYAYAADTAYTAAYAAANAANAANAYTAANAAANAAATAAYAAHAAAYAANAANAYTAANAAAYAANAAYAAASAAAASAASAASADARDSVLKKAADMGVAILKELKSPGVKWLSLIKVQS